MVCRDEPMPVGKPSDPSPGALDAALGWVSSLQEMLRKEVQNLRPADVPAASEPYTGHKAPLCALSAQQCHGLCSVPVTLWARAVLVLLQEQFTLTL